MTQTKSDRLDNKKRVGILVVHGIGRQVLPPKDKPIKLMYSHKLYSKVLRRLNKQGLDVNSEVAWHEANYAHIFNDVQSAYYQRLGNSIKRSKIRQIVIENLGDAATYRPHSIIANTQNSAFSRVQNEIKKSLMKLEGECQKGAPLIVLAHSLGGQVMMDYFRSALYWNGSRSPFVSGKTLSKFITFGCNIPLFLLGQEPENVHAFEHPNGHKSKTPWWLNVYDRDDVLGYPLVPTGKGFSDLEGLNQLEDIQVNAGNIFTRWNTLSHTQYWTNKTLVRCVADAIYRP